VIHPPDPELGDGAVPFKLVFTHPFNAGHTMDIGLNEAGDVLGFQEFEIVHRGESVSALDALEEISFASLENSGVAYDLLLDRELGLRGGGDWVLVGVPHPYYEGSEDIYIQQVTKVMVNRGGIASDWSDRVADGYPEIVPFVKPYAVWEGGMFSGKVVDGAGNPVPLAEIEVEYINYQIDMEENRFFGDPAIEKEGHGAATILADRQGNFSFVPPRAGYWGFAALGAGGDLMHDGKELSQDAVLWIEAKALEGSAAADQVEVAAETERTDEEAPADTQAASGGTSPVALIIIIAIVAILAVVFVVLARKKKS
jgi:cobalt/nickel transport protein